MALNQLTCTYTLLAQDPATGSMGVVTASACLAVGATVPFLRPGVGAVATQNLGDPRMAFAILDDLEAGVEPKDALERALKFFGDAEQRQLAVLMAAPQAGQVPYFAYTGPACEPFCGQVVSENLIALGCGMANEHVLPELEKGYRASSSPYFAERLIEGLLAAERAGGDKGGKQSASIKVVGAQSFQPPLVDLRVDDHPEAPGELHQIWMLFHRLTAGKESQRVTAPTAPTPPGSAATEPATPATPE
jgi:uncharacterized Ntn-hydrolase superfamily protein